MSLMSFKDEVIWKLHSEKSGTGDFDSRAQQEIAEWVRLTDKFAQELKKFQMNCEYCHCALDEHTVNSICQKNTSHSSHPDSPHDIKGTGRHFFRQSKPEVKDDPVRLTEAESTIPRRDLRAAIPRLLEACERADFGRDRVLELDHFREIVRSEGLNPEDVLRNVEINSQGKVIYGTLAR